MEKSAIAVGPERWSIAHQIPVLLEFVNGLLAVVDLQYSLNFADGIFLLQPA